MSTLVRAAVAALAVAALMAVATWTVLSLVTS